jgi:arylsulfatase A-like enzyme
MKRLREAGLDDRTLVFFSSDNGPQREGGNDPKFFTSAGPLRGIKRALYEGGIRVPLIARWPGKTKAGTINDHVCAFWDFLPTAAELAGAKAPQGLDGMSFVPALLGGKQASHEFLYWEFHERGFRQAVRTADWKAVRSNPGTPLELYDLNRDVAETHDVATAHADVVARVEAYLKVARTDSPHWPLSAPK